MGLELPYREASVLRGILLGLVFGITAQRSSFCKSSALAVREPERRESPGTWNGAIFAAMLGAQIAVAVALISTYTHKYFADEPELWISDIFHFDLCLSERAGDEAGQDVDEGVDGGSMPCVLQPHLRLELVEQGLDDESLAQQELVQERHQVVAHVAADAG